MPFKPCPLKCNQKRRDSSRITYPLKGVFMKRNRISGALCALLACCMLLPLLCACSSLGGTVMSLGSAKITSNMMTFWLSRYKAQFVYAYESSVKSTYGVSSLDDFWKMKQEDGTTYDELFTKYITDNARTYLCAMYLFDQFGLSLSDADADEVDSALKELVDQYADGNKSEFNTVLAAYGFNYKTLRECYLIDKKVSALQNYLFSANGPEALTDEKLEAYYKSTYVRMTQICIFINQCPELDSSGKYVTDDSGNIKYRDMSAVETQAARDRAQAALNALNGGADFAAVSDQYNENRESSGYVNGIYMSEDSVYTADADLNNLFETLKSMSAGEIKLVELDNTLHIVKKLELDAGAWKAPANSDFFSFYDSGKQNYVSFAEYVKTPFFLKYIADRLSGYSAEIKTDEDLLSKLTISSVQENYYF